MAATIRNPEDRCERPRQTTSTALTTTADAFCGKNPPVETGPRGLCTRCAPPERSSSTESETALSLIQASVSGKSPQRARAWSAHISKRLLPELVAAQPTRSSPIGVGSRKNVTPRPVGLSRRRRASAHFDHWQAFASPGRRGTDDGQRRHRGEIHESASKSVGF